MKKIYLFLNLVFCFAIQGLYAQTVNNIPLKELNVEYIEIVGVQKLVENAITIEVDYGQRTNGWGKNKRVKDEDGNKMEFNSMIDALNFLTKQGYEFVQAYAYARSQENVTRYLLRRKKEVLLP